LAPEHAETLAVPPQECLRLHEGQGASPRRQHCGCDEKPKPVERREFRVLKLPPQDRDLVPQHGVLQDEFTVASSNVSRQSASDARTGVWGDEPPDRARRRSSPVGDATQQLHPQFRPRSG
jgi:hypothetical protein